MNRKRLIAAVLAAVLLISTVLSGCYMKEAIEGVFDVTFPEVTIDLPGDSGNIDFPWDEGEGFPWETESQEPETEASASETEKEESKTESSAAEETDPEENQAFRDFTDEMFADIMSEQSSLTLHYFLLNPEAYDVDMSEISLGSFDYSESDEEEYEQELQSWLKRLHEFDHDKLDWEEKLTYDSIEEYLNTERKSIGLSLYYEPLGPNTGEQVSLPLDFAEYDFVSEADVDLYLELMNQVPDFFTEILEFEQQKADRDLFMEDDMLDETIEQCKAFLEGKEDSFLIKTFENKLEALELSEEKAAELKQKNLEAVEQLYSGYELLIAGLEKMKGSNVYQGGLCNYPDGLQYYEYLVRSGTGSSMTPEEMVRALEKDIAECASEIQLLYFQNPMLFNQLEAFEYPVTDPTLCMKILIEKTKKDFPTLDEIDYTIEYLDSSLRDYMSPACYMIPPYDVDSVNNILINCDRGEEPEDIFITLAHEGYPGHLLQTNFLKEHSTIALRYLLQTNGYAEGYAEYVEELSFRYIDEMPKALQEYMTIDTRLTLDLYARVDLGIHAEGWGVKKITSYIGEYFSEPGEVAEWMYDYILGDPAGYLDYAIGSLEIRAMKDEASEAKNFSEYNFHSTLLALSGAPFDTIRKYMFE